MKLLVLILLVNIGKIFTNRHEEYKPSELENFVILTDQNHYLSGDRMWFGAKLIKNHNTYRYSKLAYISLIDHQGKEVYQEKMLLNDKDMIYGDIFISENAPSGVYSLVIFSKWMLMNSRYPIAEKKIIVTNTKEEYTANEPDIYLEIDPILNNRLNIFHTSNKSEIIEVINENNGITYTATEVQNLKKTIIPITSNENLILIFQNRKFQIPRNPVTWDPIEYSLSIADTTLLNKTLVVHSETEIHEYIIIKELNINLDKLKLSGLTSFRLTFLDEEDHVLWTYRLQNMERKKGDIRLPNQLPVQADHKIEYQNFPPTSMNGFVFLKEEESTSILEFADILNNPNWILLGRNDKEVRSLANAVKNIKNDSLLNKEISPLMGYKPWKPNLAESFPELFHPKEYSFTIPDSILDEEVKRKVYQKHFEINEELIEINSPFDPDVKYNIDDYYDYESIEKFMQENIPQVKIKKKHRTGEKEFFLINTDNSKITFNKIPTILIDFYKIENPNEILNIDPSKIEKIEVYYNRKTVEKTNLGHEVKDGIIILYSKNNEYSLKNPNSNNKYIFQDVNFPRSPKEKPSSTPMSANSMQFLGKSLNFSRGKAKLDQVQSDTAGKWILESWIFEDQEYYSVQRQIFFNNTPAIPNSR